MIEKAFKIALVLATAGLLVFVLALEFWPGRGPTPDQIIDDYLATLQAGDEMAALALWRTEAPRNPEPDVPAIPTLAEAVAAEPDRAGERVIGGDTSGKSPALVAIDTSIELADTLADYQIGPATYWTHCCELYQLKDGADAFAARVQVQARTHLGECGAEDLATAAPEDFENRTLTFYLSDVAHDSAIYDWGLPWERWFERPHGRQVWRIVAVGEA